VLRAGGSLGDDGDDDIEQPVRVEVRADAPVSWAALR
jgi:hypothetical protein